MFTNIAIVISCIAILEGGHSGERDAWGHLNISRAALADYNAHTRQQLRVQDLRDDAISDGVARVLITEVWTPDEFNRGDIATIGRRWNGGTSNSKRSKDYGRRLANMCLSKLIEAAQLDNAPRDGSTDTDHADVGPSGRGQQ